MSQQNCGAPDELASVREQIRQLQHREEELRVVLLNDESARVGKDYVAAIRDVEQQRVDAKKLRRYYPDVALSVTRKITAQQVVLCKAT